MATIRPLPRWALPTFVALSSLAHVALWFLLLVDLRPPDLDIELQLPAEVEFGLTESVAVAPPPAPVAPEPEAPEVTEPPQDRGPAKKKRDAGAERADAGAPDAAKPERQRDAGPPRADAGAPDGETPVGSELPPGAQIAVRIDLERIRHSPIAEDVKKLLDAIPDWNALLEGSGIDPVDQLDRLLIATPNLQRSRLVVAGRYRGERSVVDTAVQQMAAARGVSAEWGRRDGVPVAPWANADATRRVIALIGPRHFSISREEDLPRLLAMAAAREKSRDDGRRPGQAPADAPHPAEALLSMPEGAGLSLEVEGVRRFVRQGRGIPAKLRVAALETPETTLRLVGRWEYDDEAQAEQARAFWDAARQAYASNTLVSLLGLAGPLREGSIEREGKLLRLRAELSVRQTKLILGYVHGLVAPAPAPPTGPAPAAPRPSPPASPRGAP